MAVVWLAACGEWGTTFIAEDDGTTTRDETTSLLPAGSSSSSSGTTASTGSDESSDDSTSTGGGFIDGTTTSVCGAPSGEFDTRSLAECSVWAQDCCEGDKCVAWANDGGNAWNATRCVPIDPDAGGVGDPCTMMSSEVSGVDTCVVSSMCWNVVDDTLTGECVGFCEGSENNPICAPEDTCVIANDGVLNLCLPSCDPLAVTPCEDGFGCYPTADEAWACLPVGAWVEIGTLRPALCPPHSTAIDVTDASFCEPATDLCCAEICDLTAPTCVEPLQCRPIAKEGNVGLCLDP